MADHENGDHGPLEIIGALVAIGTISGSRGQLVLAQLKRLAARSAGISLLIAPMTLLLPWPNAAIWFGLACMGALISSVLWCYVALAKWLTASDSDESTRGRAGVARARRRHRAGATPGHVIICPALI